MNAISSNYRELQPFEIEPYALECARAWEDPSIPRRQYEWAVHPELEKFRKGQPCQPFDALIQTLREIPEELPDNARLLDVGAASGYYREVLRIAGYSFNYTGIDSSRAFQRLALELYPDIDFDLGDACSLPYHDGWFDLVLSGAVLMHLPDYKKAIQEAERVASKYVIFHRTPVFSNRGTTYYAKEAYGVSCLEIHFDESELLDLFRKSDLDLIHCRDVFWNQSEGFGHRTYLLRKKKGPIHVQV
jgi:SAM-dependent methyltransferase